MITFKTAKKKKSVNGVLLVNYGFLMGGGVEIELGSAVFNSCNRKM